MLSRRSFLKGLILSAAGLYIPETVGKVFYSIPKIVIPHNIAPPNLALYYELEVKQMIEDIRRDINKQFFGIGKWSWDERRLT